MISKVFLSKLIISIKLILMESPLVLINLTDMIAVLSKKGLNILVIADQVDSGHSTRNEFGSM